MAQDQKFIEVTTPIIVCACDWTREYTGGTEMVDEVPIQFPNHIRFCPLHAKAQELYEALKAIPEPVVIEYRSAEPKGHVANCLFCGADNFHRAICPWEQSQDLLKEINDG